MCKIWIVVAESSNWKDFHDQATQKNLLQELKPTGIACSICRWVWEGTFKAEIQDTYAKFRYELENAEPRSGGKPIYK